MIGIDGFACSGDCFRQREAERPGIGGTGEGALPRTAGSRPISDAVDGLRHRRRQTSEKMEAVDYFNPPATGASMTTHITIEFTEHAAEAIGEQTSTSFSYDQGAHVPQPGDFVELENSRQTFFVIGRVFSLKANYCAVKLVLDLPPPDGEQDFDPAH
jgi:hypothetical protein